MNSTGFSDTHFSVPPYELGELSHEDEPLPGNIGDIS